MNYLSRIQQSLEFIESNLMNRLTLTDISRSAYFSKFHFHRIFHAITGENVMYYLRKRRLTEAAKDLLITEEKILTVALKYRFDSQESFTRSFKKMFGVTPGKYRQNNKRYLLLYKKPITLDSLQHYKEAITMQPRIVELDELKVIGMSCLTTMDDNKVPELWQTFLPRMCEIKNTTSENIALGITICEKDFDYREFKNDTEFTEIAGVIVSDIDIVPEGMITHKIAPSRYAVFTHKGNVYTMMKTYDYIYGVWLPGSSEQIKKSDSFEWYDERFKSPEDPESECDIYIPIE